MSGGGEAPRAFDRIRAQLVKHLRERLSEIADAIANRVQEAVPDSVGDHDPAYQTGILAAVVAMLDYSLAAIEYGQGWSKPIPPEALAQARRAAWAGVSLGTVLRRYVAAHGELGEFVMQEAQRCDLSNDGPALHHIRRTQEGLLEQITAAIEREYNQEFERIAHSPEQRHAEVVQKLLSAEPTDPAVVAELGYDIHSSWHVGLIVTGAEAGELIRTLEEHYARKLLAVPANGNVSAWLSTESTPKLADIKRLLSVARAGPALAVGEPGRGIDGWRLTHQQAQDALRVALLRPERFSRYEDDALLSAVLLNDTLARSLEHKYLRPLSSQRDGGTTLRHTLRVYIAVECNATSAAQELRVGRRAVKDRVCTAERLIGCCLRECLAEMHAALCFDDLIRTSTDTVGLMH